MGSFALVFTIALLFPGIPLTVLVVLHVLWTRKERNLAVLIGYLASVTSRGYPLAGALEALGRTSGGAFGDALLDMSKEIEGGMALSTALARHPKVMPDDYTALVLAGESGGRLADVFQILRRHGRHTFTHRARLFAVAVYPFILFWLVGSAGFLVFQVVLPRFVMISGDFGTSLPVTPRELLLLWHILIPLVLALTVMMVVLAVPWSSLVRREGGTGIIDTIKWWLPPSRRYERYFGVRLFAQSLEIQLRGGVPVREALRLACQVSVNGAVRKRLEVMRAEVEGGRSLSAAAARCRLFPSRYVHLLEMGETGGSLLPVLDEITSRAIDACDRIVQWICLVAVPAAVVCVGFVVTMLGIGVFRTLTDTMVHIMEGSG